MNRRRWPKGTYMRIKSGALLREMMNTRKVSNRDLGLWVGQDRSLISALANERRTTCTPAVADRIAEFFGVPTELLFEPRTSANSGQNLKKAS